MINTSIWWNWSTEYFWRLGAVFFRRFVVAPTEEGSPATSTRVPRRWSHDKKVVAADGTVMPSVTARLPLNRLASDGVGHYTLSLKNFRRLTSGQPATSWMSKKKEREKCGFLSSSELYARTGIKRFGCSKKLVGKGEGFNVFSDVTIELTDALAKTFRDRDVIPFGGDIFRFSNSKYFPHYDIVMSERCKKRYGELGNFNIDCVEPEQQQVEDDDEWSVGAVVGFPMEMHKQTGVKPYGGPYQNTFVEPFYGDVVFFFFHSYHVTYDTRFNGLRGVLVYRARLIPKKHERLQPPNT